MTPTVFDLRLPLGWLFLALGALLVFAGLTVPVESRTRSLGINIDAIWGAVMITFGILCLILARRETRHRAAQRRATRRAPTR